MQSNLQISFQLLQTITSEQAYHYRIVPIRKENGIIVFKTDHIPIENYKTELEILLGFDIHLISETTEIINLLLSTNYRKSNNTITEFQYTEDFLEKILIEAKNIGSSDIHLESLENSGRIRYRIDGKLKEYLYIPKEDLPILINKIKIKAHLDIAEKRLPQDGRITLKTSIENFDLRVSSLPSLYGEKIVLRILNRDTKSITLDNLGFNTYELHTYKQAIKKPNGIILISGPTGSGKTTTLYATLKELNKPQVNILTVEDPIEYVLEGITQVQLKEDIGLDFATTLKTFLRQDPDIIMVGEIRDKETASMAIRAALTGHLVLSTIHTNSAWATISRLIDMGIPSFLIATTLNLSIAQRLIRKLCNNCKIIEKINPEDLPNNLKIPTYLTHHYKPIGCVECHQTGYNGRKSIYEILPINDELVTKIKTDAYTHNPLELNNEYRSLKDNALQLVYEGITSIDEVFSLLI